MATTASLPAYLLPGVTVHQPPHLEGDASLATEILPGPPTPAALQQSALKRDPRKPSMAYSYLPPSDPGSTYSGLTHGTLIGQDLEGPRSKRPRTDKGTTGRAQRASARNQGNTTASATADPSSHTASGPNSSSNPINIDGDSPTAAMDKEPSLSRSTSSANLLELQTSSTNGKTKRKDKGKAKEVESPPLRVKEEPKTFSLPTPEPPSNLLNNEDHCSSCRSYGSLVYCDGCPKAFHFWCLDPPMENMDDDGDARSFLRLTINMIQHPPRKPPHSLFAPLIHHLQVSNPVEYQLPEDIRTFFKDVGTGPKGNYVDSSEIKAPRLNRHGQLEERDPYRLRDRNGNAVLCYHCGLSALPNTLGADGPSASKGAPRFDSTATSVDTWKGIVSCDYCNLHWHMDCVDPPLLTLPPFNKKWMCPNHAERVMPLKRRVPKNQSTPIEITKPRQFNNGNIEVIHSELPSSNIVKPTFAVDEVLINGRRYRVPERVIVLDFWNKLNKWEEHVSNRDADSASGMSSPLTSLSSLDDSDDMTSTPAMPTGDFDPLTAAQYPRVDGNPVEGNKSSARPVKIAKTSSGVSMSGLRKRRTSQVLPEASTRELRSRSRNNLNGTPVAASSRADGLNREALNENPGIAESTKEKPVNVKMEEIDNASFMSGSLSEMSVASSSGIAKASLRNSCFDNTAKGYIQTSRTIRTPRRAKAKEADEPAPEKKEKRGRKRKVRDEEAQNGENSVGGNNSKVVKREKLDKDARIISRTPIRPNQLNTGNHDNGTPTTSLRTTSLAITPSFKIRLPRLSNLNVVNSSVSLPNPPSQDSPTRR
ncbi:hypothetical protein CPC08DRAFT_758219 [Agrocybe pediades]|nr:hypothetical protein CPC08DRAFT_758219 [Agrocybe pediades]